MRMTNDPVKYKRAMNKTVNKGRRRDRPFNQQLTYSR